MFEKKRITVRVIPNSSRTEVRSVENGVYKIAIKAPPENGKANIELIKFLNKQSKRKAKILSGATSKTKIVQFY